MSLISKFLSKKAIAVVCTIALLLSVVSVCFSAIALTPADTTARTAIPVKVGNLYDIKDIYVKLSDGSEVKADTLNWTSPSANITVSGTMVAVVGEGAVLLTGTAADAKTATLCVVPVNANNAATIFDYTFSASDAGLAATDANGKAIWAYSGAGSWSWVTDAQSWVTVKEPRLRNDGGAGVIYLNPESEPGKIVSSFADYTFELKAVTHENWTAQGKYFPMLTRYNMAGDTYSLTNDTYLGYRAYFSTTGGSVYVAGSAVADSATTWAYTNDHPHSDFKLKVDGSEVIFSAKPGNASEYTQVFKMSDAGTVPDAVLNTVGKAGTIGVYTDAMNRPSLQKAKVTVEFKDSDFLAAIPVISDANSVIPAKVNTCYDLSNSYFALSDSTIAKGSDITWTTTSENIVIDGTKVAVVGEGTAVVKGTSAASATISFTLITTDDNNEAVVLDYTFSAADAGLAVTDANGKAIWAYSGTGSWGWVDNKNLGTSQPRLRNDSGAGVIYLNPESEPGKLVSSFADYTFELRAVTHENWTAQGKYFPMLTRYNMAGDTYSLTADTYLGYRAYFSTNGGSVYVGGSNVLASSVTWPYSSSAPHVDFKMEVSGEELIFSAKPFSASEYTQVFKMSDADSVPDAVLNTVGKAGTIGVYTDTQNRPSLQKAKVTLKFAASDYLDGCSIITEAKPVIPAKVSTLYDLSDTYFALSNDTIAKGSDLTWTTTDSDIIIKGSKIAVIGEGKSQIVGTSASSGTIAVCVTTTNDNDEGLIYEHTFVSTDIENGDFTADSEWISEKQSGMSIIYKNDGVAFYNTAADSWSDVNASGRMYLNPESKNGKLVSAFTDITIEARAFINQQWSGTYGGEVGPFVRYDKNAATRIGAYYRIPCADYTSTALSLPVGASSVPATAQSFNLAAAAANTFVLKVDGSTITTTANGQSGSFTIGDGLAATIPAINKGTIGFGYGQNHRTSLQYVKVSAKFADSDYIEGVPFVTLEKPTAPANTTFTYNGEDQTYEIAENSAYTITGNVQKNAGAYTVTVALNGASSWTDGTTDDLTFDFIIGRKDVTVTANAAEKEFGNADPTLTYTAEGLVGSDALSGALTRAAGESVGSYAIEQGTVNNDSNPNYNITFVGNTFKVTKTNQAAVEITNKPSGEIVYGDEFTLGTTGGSGTGAVTWAITEGAATVDNTGKVTVTGVGQVTVTATKAGDNDYEAKSASYTFTAVKATPVLGTVTVNGTVTDAMTPSQVVLNKQSGPDGTLVITDTELLSDKTSYSWKFTPADAANYNEVTGTITINVVDKTYPTAQIKVNGEDANADPTNITIEFIVKTPAQVIISAEDNAHGSGIDSIEYAVSDKILDVTKFDTLTYAGYNGAFDVPEGKAIVYVKVTDIAGNTAYFVADGIIVDTTAPVIKDVADGDEFDGNKVIEVEDALSGVDSVKVDGTPATVEDGKFTVIANDAERTITVTDKAGNTTEIKITLNKVYTATFKGENGVITTITLKPGETLTMPAVPTKEGYTVKWDKTVDALTEDIEINAVYTKIETEKETEKEEDKKPDSPKTNDITNLWFWVVALVVSGAVLTVSLKAKKVR